LFASLITEGPLSDGILRALPIVPSDFGVGLADIVGVERQSVRQAPVEGKLMSQAPDYGSQNEGRGVDGFSQASTRGPGGGFSQGKRLGGNPANGVGPGLFHGPSHKFLRCDDHFVAEALEPGVSPRVERGEELAATRIGEGRYPRLVAFGLDGDGFHSGDHRDAHSTRLGPSLGGGQADPDTGEGAGAGGDRAKCDLGERYTGRQKNPFNGGKQPDGVVLGGVMDSDLEHFGIAKKGDTAVSVAGVESEEKHGEILPQSGELRVSDTSKGSWVMAGRREEKAESARRS
jgi:hypothetical protein